MDRAGRIPARPYRTRLPTKEPGRERIFAVPKRPRIFTNSMDGAARISTTPNRTRIGTQPNRTRVSAEDPYQSESILDRISSVLIRFGISIRANWQEGEVDLPTQTSRDGSQPTFNAYPYSGLLVHLFVTIYGAVFETSAVFVGWSYSATFRTTVQLLSETRGQLSQTQAPLNWKFHQNAKQQAFI